MRQKLDLESLHQLEGGVVSHAFDLELGRIVADIKDRPGEKRPRSLMIKLDIAPMADERGIAVHSAVAFEVKSTLPSKKTTDFRMAINTNADQLDFNPNTPEDPDQGHLADVNPKAKGDRAPK